MKKILAEGHTNSVHFQCQPNDALYIEIAREIAGETAVRVTLQC